MTNGAALGIDFCVAGRRSQDFLQHRHGVRGVAVLTVLGEKLRRLGAVRARPELCLDYGVHDLLRPFRPLFQIALMHEDDTAGMIAPDVTCEAQDLSDALHLGGRIEGVGDDVASDPSRSQRGRHRP